MSTTTQPGLRLHVNWTLAGLPEMMSTRSGEYGL